MQQLLVSAATACSKVQLLQGEPLLWRTSKGGPWGSGGGGSCGSR
jgi:hypothetical protein